MSSTYTSEIAFINRKLPTLKIKWEPLTALAQIISQPFSEAEAQSVIAQLKDALGKKAGAMFIKMVFTVNSKLRGGNRIVVAIPVLREFFAGEIDTDFSGGGKGLNPLQTRPSPRGGI